MNFDIKSQKIEHLLPLWKWEDDFLLSKTADVTACYELTLPEIFTRSEDEYLSMHKCFVMALRDFPDNTLVHKQDIFFQNSWRRESLQGSSFLECSYQNHFRGRPFLSHRCYLYVTMTSKEGIQTKSIASALCRNRLVPKEMMDKDRWNAFRHSLSRLEQVLKDGGVRVRRLAESEIVGEEDRLGLVEQYVNLDFSQESTVLKDLHLEDGTLMVGDKYVSCFSLSSLETVPSEVSEYSHNKRFSNPPNFYMPQSLVANLSVLLPFEHIYNQYFFLDENESNLKKIRQKGKLQQAFASASRENLINLERNTEYLDEAFRDQKRSIRCAFNVLVWDLSWESLLRKNAKVESAMSAMNCCTKTKTEKVVPQVFWGGIPGAATQYPAELTFLTFLEQGCCFLNYDSNYQDMVTSSDFGINLTDRVAGIPVRIDLDDYPKKMGWIDNRNKVIIGPSGSGKSFFTNDLVRQYWEQGAHIVLVDIGDSYEGLCQLIREETKGEDGCYFTYTEEHPLSFNPFWEPDRLYNEEKKEQLLTLVKTLWKGDREVTNSEETHLKVCIGNYLDELSRDKNIVPCFDTFYQYLKETYKPYIVEQQKVRMQNFDIDDLIQVLKPFSTGGMFGHLLNSTEEVNLLEKRFIIFELDNIKDNKTLFPIVTLIIMATFMDKIRRLPFDQRKLMLIEEAWQAIAKEGMATFIGYLYRTARKHFGEIAIVTQEPDDLVGNKFIKDIMVTQSHCKILLDLRDFKEKSETIQEILSLSKKEQNILFSVNNALDFSKRSRYKEVFITLRGYCAVYGVEVSKEEYCTFTTDKEEKGMIKRIQRNESCTLKEAIKSYIKKNMS